MPKPDVIAERTLYRQEGNRWQPVRITFERPREEPTSEWGCRYAVHGFEQTRWPTTKVIYGVDAVQAFELASRLVDQILMHSRAFAAGQLAWAPDGEPLDRGQFSGPMPPQNLKRDRMVASEIVRTVELAIDWPLPASVLRVEVLSRPITRGEMGYWTRVWRTDSYRLASTASAASRGQKRGHADETVLVEDDTFSGDGFVFEKTPEAAIEETMKKIRWQLFAEKKPGKKRSPAHKKAASRRRPTR
jgi:hypothetical protein